MEHRPHGRERGRGGNAPAARSRLLLLDGGIQCAGPRGAARDRMAGRRARRRGALAACGLAMGAGRRGQIGRARSAPSCHTRGLRSRQAAPGACCVTRPGTGRSTRRRGSGHARRCSGERTSGRHCLRHAAHWLAGRGTGPLDQPARAPDRFCNSAACPLRADDAGTGGTRSQRRTAPRPGRTRMTTVSTSSPRKFTAVREISAHLKPVRADASTSSAQGVEAAPGVGKDCLRISNPVRPELVEGLRRMLAFGAHGCFGRRRERGLRQAQAERDWVSASRASIPQPERGAAQRLIGDSVISTPREVTSTAVGLTPRPSAFFRSLGLKR
jgi:hypothetical protein